MSKIKQVFDIVDYLQIANVFCQSDKIEEEVQYSLYYCPDKPYYIYMSNNLFLLPPPSPVLVLIPTSPILSFTDWETADMMCEQIMGNVKLSIPPCVADTPTSLPEQTTVRPPNS